jgi:predicted permease
MRALSDLGQDVRYSWRSLARAPGLVLAAALTLSLGIGAVTAVFTLLDRASLRTLPIHDPHEVVEIQSIGFEAFAGRSVENRYFSYPTYERLRGATRTLAAVFATSFLPRVSVAIDGAPEITAGELVSGNYFTALGVRPAAGRLLTDDDDRAGGTTAVISHRFWQRRFNGSPRAIGTSITINATPVTVVGVMPSEFFGHTVGVLPDVVLPMRIRDRIARDGAALDSQNFSWTQVLGRLRPGAAPSQAATELGPLYRDAQTAAGQDGARQIRVQPVPHGVGGPALRFAEPLRLLFIAAGVVLLIACVNVANLLLARAEVRQSERSVRIALGAGRWRLVRQGLTEASLLAAAGGLGGLALALVSARALSAIVASGPAGIVVNPWPDGRVLLFASAATLATVFVCGLIPALRTAPRIVTSRTISARLPWQSLLLATQIAMSLVVVAGTALLLQTVRNLTGVDTGFDRQQLLTFTINPFLAGYETERAGAASAAVLDRLAASPGVVSAAASLAAPLNIETHFVGAVKPSSPDGRQVPIVMNGVSPGYLATLRIPLISGREFTRADAGDRPSVVILSAGLARRLFADRDPIGQRIAWSGPVTLEVVGVAGDTIYGGLGELREPRSIAYIPLAQFSLNAAVTVTVRHDGAPADAAAAARAAVAGVDRTIPVAQMRTFDELVADALIQQRLLADVSSALAGLSLLLASVGLYGLMSFVVARRRRDIGVRMALGAAPGRVVRGTLRAAMIPVLFGLLAGGVAAYGLLPLVRPFLFDVSPTDPATLATAIAVLTVVALFAALTPARRASRVDPIVVLRSE